VYGPSRVNEKADFLTEIRNTKPPPNTKWLILGDFNLIYKAQDKNNANLNLHACVISAPLSTPAT
jgi:hypothetical protein